MKKLYEMPSIELTKFDVEDVITASTAVAGEAKFMEDTGIDAVAKWNSDWNNSWDDSYAI